MRTRHFERCREWILLPHAIAGRDQFRNEDLKRSGQDGLERDRGSRMKVYKTVDLRAAAGGSEEDLEHMEILEAELGENDGWRCDAGG